MSTAPGRAAWSAWLADLTAGGLVGILAVALTISFAVLVFANALAPFLGEGVGLALLSTVLVGVVVAVRSSLPGMVAHVQDAPVAILAVAAANAVAGMPAGLDGRDVFVTVVAANALATLLCGLVLLVLGAFRLGRLVRYLPYPVVGGFLAGTGWLLFTGGIGVMAGVSPTWETLGDLAQPELAARWLPGAALAVLFLVATRRFRHFLVWPGLLALSVAGFFGVMAWLGADASEWRAAGLLLGPFPDGQLLRTFDYGELGRVHWPTVVGYGATAVTVALIATMAVLFNATGLELATRRRLDLDRELRAAGLGNVLAGAAGGLAGYQLLSLTVLNHQIGTGSRATALVAVATAALMVAFGAPLLAFVPMVIVGSVLSFLGLAFLYEWVYQSWFKLSKLEYAVVLLILVVISGVGFVEGVAAGIAAAVVLFVVNYSRAEVVKHALTGAAYRSRLVRSEAEARRLDEMGAQLVILELQGYIFFGTASKLLDRVASRLAGDPPARFVLLDFRQVTGLDATALMGFEQLAQLMERRDATMVLTGLAPGLRAQLERSDIIGSDRTHVRVEGSLDEGLESCEEALLREGARDARAGGLMDLLERRLAEPARAAEVLAYFERLTLPSGAYLMRQGDAPDVLYFVESGRVTAQLARDGHADVRLESMYGGSMVGELGFYSGRARSASVVADEETSLYRLTAESLERMKREAPDLAAGFHELVVRLLAERVRHLVRVVDALRG